MSGEPTQDSEPTTNGAGSDSSPENRNMTVTPVGKLDPAVDASWLARALAYRPDALTLLLAIVGGTLAEWAGLPAGLMAGAMAAVALGAVAGWNVRIDDRLRTVSFVALGSVLGSAATPETLASLPRWPYSLAALALAVAAMMWLIPRFLVRAHCLDVLTARCAAVPGALSYVLAISLEAGADTPRVAILQTLRLALLVILVPLVMVLTVDTAAFIQSDLPPVGGWALAGLMAACAVAAWVGTRLGLPAPAFVASMGMSVVLHAAGLVEGRPPDWIAVPALVTAGAVIGARFAGTTRTFLFASLGMGTQAVAIALGLSLVFAWPVAHWLELPFIQVWLAFTPGGLDTTTVLAFALGVDPAFVAGHQLMRFLGLSVVVPFLLKAEGHGDGGANPNK